MRRGHATGWLTLIALAVLAVIGVTGFAWPGYFLDEDDEQSGPQARVVRAIVAGIEAADNAALRELRCGDATSNVGEAIDSVASVEGAQFAGHVRRSDGATYTAVIDVSNRGRSLPFTVVIAESGGKWCWRDIAVGTESDTPADSPTSTSDSTEGSSAEESDSTGPAVVPFEQLIVAINSGDRASAEALLCVSFQESNSETLDRLFDDQARLRLENARDHGDFGVADVSGSAADGMRRSGRLHSTDEDGSWCVDNIMIQLGK